LELGKRDRPLIKSIGTKEIRYGKEKVGETMTIVPIETGYKLRCIYPLELDHPEKTTEMVNKFPAIVEAVTNRLTSWLYESMNPSSLVCAHVYPILVLQDLEPNYVKVDEFKENEPKLFKDLTTELKQYLFHFEIYSADSEREGLVIIFADRAVFLGVDPSDEEVFVNALLMKIEPRAFTLYSTNIDLAFWEMKGRPSGKVTIEPVYLEGSKEKPDDYSVINDYFSALSSARESMENEKISEFQVSMAVSSILAGLGSVVTVFYLYPLAIIGTIAFYSSALSVGACIGLRSRLIKYSRWLKTIRGYGFLLLYAGLLAYALFVVSLFVSFFFRS